MILEGTDLPGLLVIRPTPHEDERGLFARTYCRDAFEDAGITFIPRQMSTSFNRAAWTLRGLHWQADPHGEAKLVRVTRGEMFDVAVDLRPGSPTFRRWFGLTLSAENRRSLFIPAGFAHGFLTLQDETEIVYATDAPYMPDAACGACYDDPAFGIAWPTTPKVMNGRDRTWPLFGA